MMRALLSSNVLLEHIPNKKNKRAVKPKGMGNFFIISVLFADYSNIENSAEYSDYSKFIFFLRKNMPSFPIIHF